MNFERSLERSDNYNFDYSKNDEIEIEKALKDLLETVFQKLILLNSLFSRLSAT